jgi:hypothetical protein
VIVAGPEPYGPYNIVTLYPPVGAGVERVTVPVVDIPLTTVASARATLVTDWANAVNPSKFTIVTASRRVNHRIGYGTKRTIVLEYYFKQHLESPQRFLFSNVATLKFMYG